VDAAAGRSSLDVTLQRLTRAFQLTRGLVRAMGGWMAGVPYWDAKLALGDHLWANAQSAADLLRRLHELKETGAERQESAVVDGLIRELMAAEDGDAFLWGCHGTLLARLQRLLADWADECDPIMDPHSRRLLAEAAGRLGEQSAWYSSYEPAYSPGALRKSAEWAAHLARWCDGIDFTGGVWRGGSAPEELGRVERKPFDGIAIPRRDACFRTAWSNEIVRNAGDDLIGRRRAIFYNHTQEMQFAESLAAILWDTPEMPWAFHFDLARHCTDEIRHTRMGCTRLAQLGEDLRQFPMLLQNYSVRAKLEPLERFCLMTLVIEASSFEKKRANVQFFATHGDTVSERYESYDIRDEMLHVTFGHTWVPILLRVKRDARSVNELIAHCRDILEDALKDERRAV
jgi:hypothetical protein